MAFSLNEIPELAADAEKVLAEVESVLTFINKYDSVLPIPAVVKTTLVELIKVVGFAQDVVAKFE